MSGSSTPHAKIARSGGKTIADTGLRKYFEAAVRYKASDIILRSGQAPRLRLKGGLKALDTSPLKAEDFEKWLQEGMSDEHWDRYEHYGSADLGFDLNMGDEGTHRFRLNIFRTRGRSAIAGRRVDNKILTFDQLYLPPVMADVCLQPNGIVLLCGVTGSGKSTTIASMLQYVNDRKNVHIVTIEDPIEFLFEDSKAMINQREVGIDVANFEDGLRALVRENPDVVLIGEMRDRETFEAALHAAETGHLVFGTIHASSASQAFGRIYDLFPANEREQIRTMLAYQFQAFIYQKLLPTLHENIPRIPAIEILLQTPRSRKYVLDGNENELPGVMRDSRELGMQTFTDALVDLVQKQFVHPKVAAEVAPNPDELKMRLKGIG
ncbi:MAG TPA: twitching motility protein PilT [Phycisphaerales bacterium]|nr:twitching motility protein PilT [Phycisphaerales bacterium]HCD31962.1 twitching motility protein PilT [Phycisphaerales bacterium]|tara:strand:- start:370 stop:1509 length:1140 start_codon:yes stop_codon:yes gene_type:complete